jgi:hypothetical protein
MQLIELSTSGDMYYPKPGVHKSWALSRPSDLILYSDVKYVRVLSMKIAACYVSVA